MSYIATLEKALNHKLAQAAAYKWAADNKAAINAFNIFAQDKRCFGDEFKAISKRAG